jgi:hypothetical protein
VAFKPPATIGKAQSTVDFKGSLHFFLLFVLSFSVDCVPLLLQFENVSVSVSAFAFRSPSIRRFGHSGGFWTSRSLCGSSCCSNR